MQNGTGKVRFYHRVILNKPKNINSEKQYNGNQNQYTFGFCGQSFTLQRKQKPNSQYRQQKYKRVILPRATKIEAK